MNRALMEQARSMLNNAGLEHELWTEAMSMAYYLVNHLPFMALIEKTSEKIWFKNFCDYSNLKIFGCHAYTLVPNYQKLK